MPLSTKTNKTLIILGLCFLSACGTSWTGTVLGGGTDGAIITDSTDDDLDNADDAIPDATGEVTVDDAAQADASLPDDTGSGNLDAATPTGSDDEGDADYDGGTPSGPVAFPVTWPKEGDDCNDTEITAVSYNDGGETGTTYFYLPNDGRSHRFRLSGTLQALVCEYDEDKDASFWTLADALDGDFVITILGKRDSDDDDAEANSPALLVDTKKIKVRIDWFQDE